MKEQDILIADIRKVEDPYEEFVGNGEACRFCFARKGRDHHESCLWQRVRYVDAFRKPADALSPPEAQGSRELRCDADWDVICPDTGCGRGNPDSAENCLYCGTALAIPLAARTMKIRRAKFQPTAGDLADAHLESQGTASERRVGQRRSEANTPRSESGLERRTFSDRRAGLDGTASAAGRAPEPTHIRDDYREVWLSGWRAGKAEAAPVRYPEGYWSEPIEAEAAPPHAPPCGCVTIGNVKAPCREHQTIGAASAPPPAPLSDQIVDAINREDWHAATMLLIQQVDGLYREAPPHATNQWQTIETAPKDGTEVLLAGGAGIDIGNWQEEKPDNLECGVIVDPGLPEGWYGYLGLCPWDEPQPTHWMPLPLPPSSPAPNSTTISRELGKPAGPTDTATAGTDKATS